MGALIIGQARSARVVLRSAILALAVVRLTGSSGEDTEVVLTGTRGVRDDVGVASFAVHGPVVVAVIVDVAFAVIEETVFTELL